MTQEATIKKERSKKTSSTRLVVFLRCKRSSAAASLYSRGECIRESQIAWHEGIANIRGTASIIQFPELEEVPTTFKEDLENFQRNFGLQKSQLALLMCVSRPTLNGWLDEAQEPREISVKRLDELSTGLAKLASSQLAHALGATLKMRLNDEVNDLYCALTAETLDINHIQKALYVARKRIYGKHQGSLL